MTAPRAAPPDRVVAVLKSPRYGPMPAGDRALPYRIDRLEEHGFSLRWTDPADPTPWRRQLARLERAGVPVAQAWASRRQRRDASAVVAMFESEGHGLALARLLTQFLTRFSSRQRRPPLVIIGCWLADLVAGSPARRHLYRQLYRSVDAVIVFSTNQRATLVELLGMAPERVHVVAFGIDLDELAAMVPSDAGRVAAIGRDLGRDWATLASAARSSGWAVDLVTRPGQVAGLDLPPEIHLHPPVDRPTYLDLLASSSVVVVPTEVRQYPTGQTVLLEAMALAKACVVTDTPAMREYASDGETAVLVPPHDPVALRSAVDALLADPDRRHRLGHAAATSEHTRGGAAEMWRQIGQVIDQLA